MQQPFTLTDFLVSFGVLAFGLLVIIFFNEREMRRMKREQNKRPSATRPRIVEMKLDEIEEKIS